VRPTLLISSPPSSPIVIARLEFSLSSSPSPKEIVLIPGVQASTARVKGPASLVRGSAFPPAALSPSHPDFASLLYGRGRIRKYSFTPCKRSLRCLSHPGSNSLPPLPAFYHGHVPDPLSAPIYDPLPSSRLSQASAATAGSAASES